MTEVEQAMQYWQLDTLYTTEKSQESGEQKLREIALQWLRFDYPEE